MIVFFSVHIMRQLVSHLRRENMYRFSMFTPLLQVALAIEPPILKTSIFVVRLVRARDIVRASVKHQYSSTVVV
jgi:hypothetical protein